MTRKLGKTPVKRLRVTDGTWKQFEALKGEKESWEDFINRISLWIYENSPQTNTESGKEKGTLAPIVYKVSSLDEKTNKIIPSS
jgi:hypothetical protein